MSNIKLGVKVGDKTVIFNLREISQAEENRFTSRFLEIPANSSEDERVSAEYAIYVDALANWSDQLLVKNGSGVEEPYPTKEDASPSDAVRLFFSDRTPANERIAPALIVQYRRKLQPDVVFF